MPVGYVSFGDEGIVRVENGITTRLFQLGVGWAADDFMGGVVFTRETETPWINRPVYWLPRGSAEPRLLTSAIGVESVTVVDGRPALIHTSDDDRYGATETGGIDTWHLLVTAVESGHRCLLYHHSDWFEGGVYGVTGGGGRFVGIQWDVMSDWRLLAFDLNGVEVDLPSGVHPEPGPSAGWGCWRVCELDGLMSPDGRHLVTWFWPEAEAPCDDHLAWWEKARLTPATIRITDLEKGEAWYESEVPAETMLADFDGRFLAMREVTRIPQESTTTNSTLIIDTLGEFDAVRVTGRANLTRTLYADLQSASSMDVHWTVVLDSIDVGNDPYETSDAYELARQKAGEHASRGIDYRLLLSDDYVSLNPGYWVVTTGAFQTRDEASFRCRALVPSVVDDCYPRYVETPMFPES